MLKRLVKLASVLDGRGLQKEAGFLYAMIKEASRQDQLVEEGKREQAEAAEEAYRDRRMQMAEMGYGW